MQTRLAILLMTLVLALAPAGFAGGKKEDKAAVSFHMETEATDNPKMIFPEMVNGQRRFFRRMPEAMIKDIVSFSPFVSDSGESGIVFKLKDNAARRIAAITSVNQGRWMIAQVNGRVVDGLFIDKSVNDGVLVVWSGITPGDIAMLDESLPRIGQEGQKKKKK